MKILLDFDGVLNITPSWKPIDQLEDGFMSFQPQCAENINELIKCIIADIVLAKTHRIHFENQKWSRIFANRKIDIPSDKIFKVNHATQFSQIGNRCNEVLEWITDNPRKTFIIIDDDNFLRNLPLEYKARWVETSFLIGFNTEKLQQALSIIKG